MTEEEQKLNIRHPLAHPKGGIILKDEGNLAPKAFKAAVARISKKIVKGQFASLFRSPSPAYIHYPKSFLQTAAYDLSYCSTFMAKAALESDPVERLKLVIATYIGGQHINPSLIGLRAPLNPVLGETS